MSYDNFKARVWSAAIERDLQRKSVFLEDCNREYEGVVKNAGDSVRMLGVGKPAITKQKGGKVILDGAETVEDMSSTLKVDNIAYYNFAVDNIDRAQLRGRVMEALRAEATEGLANAVDEDIAALALDPLAVKLQGSPVSITRANVLNVFNEGMQRLLENDVSMNTTLYATVPPWMWICLFGKLTELDTDNSGRIRTLNLGRYGMVQFQCSNNVANSGGADYVMLRTRRAVSAVVAARKAIAYNPENSFEDALKGYILYGQKIQRPKELIVIPCIAGSEA